MSFDLIRENIECEQPLGENSIDTVVKEEYIIPDTMPDISEILSLDVRPLIISKEVTQEKVYVEGLVEYSFLYLAKEDEGVGVYSAVYSGKLKNYIDVVGLEHDMLCEVQVGVEHMKCDIINERKFSVEGILNLQCETYKKYSIEFIKEVENSKDVQIMKTPYDLDKVVGFTSIDLAGKIKISIDEDKPEIGSILKYNAYIHKKELIVEDGKINVSSYLCIEILYRALNSKELLTVDEDIELQGEAIIQGVESDMNIFGDFVIEGVNRDVKEDDLGEKRILEIEALVKANIKVMCRDTIDLLEDVYSNACIIDVKKEQYIINVVQGTSLKDITIKGNMDYESIGNKKVLETLLASCNVYLTDTRILEDKVAIDGILTCKCTYKTDDNEKNIENIEDEIPFNTTIDIPGTKIDMDYYIKSYIESTSVVYEKSGFSIKAVCSIFVKVYYDTKKDFVINIEEAEGDIPTKKASFILYKVENGDTLWNIAKKYYTTIDEIAIVNEIENNGIIKPGEKLIIPGRSEI
ncbi:MAG: SPOCS domain-containing protein [Clostridiaceae bacterium]